MGISMEEKFLLNREEISKYLGCSPETADRNYLYEPDFPYTPQGKQRHYIKEEVYKWLVRNQKYN